ncbi:MAG: sugar-binding protein [Victivallales bacterium]
MSSSYSAEETLTADAVSSQYQETLLLGSFDKNPDPLWHFQSSPNANSTISFGHQILCNGQPLSLFKGEFHFKEASKGEGFSLGRHIEDASAWKDADGICVILGVREPGRWLSIIQFECGDSALYGVQAAPAFIDRGMVLTSIIFPFNSVAPLKESKSKEDFDCSKVKYICLQNIAVDNGSVYIQKVFLYKLLKNATVGLKTTSSKPGLNIYERNEPVEFTFTANSFPVGASAVELIVSDYFGKETAKVTLKPSDASGKTYKVSLGSMPSGYYDMRAWWVDSKGTRIEKDSCILGGGTLGQGRATFAVMPKTISENNARREKYLSKAFFGLHTGGNDHGIQELLGVCWNSKYDNWNIEPEKPDRSSGTAKWASDRISTSSPRPEIELHLLNLLFNLVIPRWARSDTPGEFPGFKWNYFQDHLTDYIKVEKHLYPHMKNHVYDVAWEINANTKEHIKNDPAWPAWKPAYSSEDIVELYKQARTVIKTQDDDAILIGPCVCGTEYAPWVDTLFQAGLGKYIDAVNTHLYNPPPPEYRLIKGVRDLSDVIRKHNGGKDMDIYNTELGYMSQYGGSDRAKEQAQWHTRAAIILKGEGLKAHFIFYTLDLSVTDPNNSWGLCYVLNQDFKWSPDCNDVDLSPKPVLPAYAVCVDQLEGAAPLSDLPFFGSDIYSYLFIKEGEPVLTIWSVEQNHRVLLKVHQDTSSGTPLELVDMMGNTTAITPKDSCINLDVSPSVLYLKGLSPELYGKPLRKDSFVATAFPGTGFKLRLEGQPSLPTGFTVTKTEGNRFSFWDSLFNVFGIGIDTKKNGGALFSISIDASVPAGPYPICAGKSTKWIQVCGSVSIPRGEPALQEGCLGVSVSLKNHSPLPVNASISLKIDDNGTREKELLLPANATAKTFFPFKTAKPGTTYSIELAAKPEGMDTIRSSQKINFLSAHRVGEPSEGKIPNTISWSGKGSSGRVDSATATFTWDDANLYIIVSVNDDEFDQNKPGDILWLEDDLQVAFDTHPEFDELYNPLADIFTKKLSSLSFARSNGRNIAWRHDSFNKKQLSLGDVTKDFPMEISRDDNALITTYKITVPWAQIGLEKVEKGKPIGIDLLINDKDSNGSRAGLELFHAIMRGRKHTLYGSMFLQ